LDPEALQHVLEAESEYADNETAIITEIRTLASELRTTKKRSDKRAKVSLESNLDLGNDLSRKPTLEEKILMERKSTDGDKKRGFESSTNSGFDDDEQSGLTSSTEPMLWGSNGTMTAHETISAREVALLEEIENLRQQVMENNQQFGQKRELSWAFPMNGPVPANVVKELYKQLNPSLKISREQFSKAVNDIPAMSRHVIVEPDPSVSSGLVEIINEEFEKVSILFATNAPIANANGAHIDSFVMDSHVLSTNTCIATSPNGMITNKPWSPVDRLQHYMTAYMDGSRVAISAALPLLLSVSINSNPDCPSLLILGVRSSTNLTYDDTRWEFPI
jgi:hypothetical protein